MPKKYQVIKATTRELSGLAVGGRVKKFAGNGTFETSDSGEAAEIDKVLGAKGTGEVVVTPYETKEQGHTYTFGTSSRFANAWDEMMKRRKAKTQKKPRRGRKSAEAGNGKNTIQPNA